MPQNAILPETEASLCGTDIVMTNRATLGIIGGSGLYQIDELENQRWEEVSSAYGEPSDALLFGDLHGQPLIFLPRHGRGHRIPPSEINYRANIDALKRAGASMIIAVNAVGSLQEQHPPGKFLLPDQFIDRTSKREKSFFGKGLAAHISMAAPVCPYLTAQLHAVAATEMEMRIARSGTCIVIEGPAFSGRAEAELYRSWGCDIIGMTSLPEAALAREAELCYAVISMVTDYDCWHPGHDKVSADAVVKVFQANIGKVRELLVRAVPRIGNFDRQGQQAGNKPKCSCAEALDHAVITHPEFRDPQQAARLSTVAGRVLGNPKTD